MKTVYTLLLITGAQLLSAQSIHFSQFERSSSFNNPAMTGATTNWLDITLHGRQQWAQIPEAYTSGSLQVELAKNRMRWGLNLLNNQAGNASLKETCFIASANRKFQLTEHTSFFTGLSVGFTQKSFDPSAFIFESQFIDQGALINPESGEVFFSTSRLLPRFSSGLFASRNKKRIFWNMGVAMHVANQPEQTFYEFQSHQWPRRTTASGQFGAYLADNKFAVSISGLYSSQGHATMKIIRGQLDILKFSKANLQVGVANRVADAWVFHAGIKFNKANLVFSYDHNTSSLQPGSLGQGAYELSLRISPTRFKSSDFNPDEMEWAKQKETVLIPLIAEKECPEKNDTVFIEYRPPSSISSMPNSVEEVDYTKYLHLVINFDVDLSYIRPEFQIRLYEFMQKLNTLDYPYVLLIHGHTDADGTDEYNIQLGQRRALATRNMLKSYGVTGDKLHIQTFGEFIPMASNHHLKGKSLNRRVEIIALPTDLVKHLNLIPQPLR